MSLQQIVLGNEDWKRIWPAGETVAPWPSETLPVQVHPRSPPTHSKTSPSAMKKYNQCKNQCFGTILNVDMDKNIFKWMHLMPTHQIYRSTLFQFLPTVSILKNFTYTNMLINTSLCNNLNENHLNLKQCTNYLTSLGLWTFGQNFNKPSTTCIEQTMLLC